MNNLHKATAAEILNILCPMLTQFAAVAREGQITKAASALDVPQPTITRHLARLESVLGVRLYKRVQGGMSLTAAGDRLVAPVEQALGLLGEAIDGLDSGIVSQRISFGFLHMLGVVLVQSFVSRFGSEHPEYSFSVVEAS